METILATGRPYLVTVIASPSSTRSMIELALSLSSRMPTVAFSIVATFYRMVATYLREFLAVSFRLHLHWNLAGHAEDPRPFKPKVASPPFPRHGGPSMGGTILARKANVPGLTEPVPKIWDTSY